MIRGMLIKNISNVRGIQIVARTRRITGITSVIRVRINDYWEQCVSNIDCIRNFSENQLQTVPTITTTLTTLIVLPVLTLPTMLTA